MARSKRGGGVKVTPNLAGNRKSTRLLNLRVLRRADPAVHGILITATHIAAYSFDAGEMKWSRKPVEGSLFVVRRNTHPRFQLVVMNRLNTENLVEDLVTDFEFEVQVPYVFCRNAAQEIVGIWFYDPHECEEVAHLFIRINIPRGSRKANISSKSVFEEPASGPSALPAAGDTLEHPTSPTMVADDVEESFLTPSKATTCVDTIGGTGAVQPNQSFRTIPSPSHGSRYATAPQASSLHGLVPFDAHRPDSSTTVEPASLLNSEPPLLAPMASTQSTITAAASSLSPVPPLHSPFANDQPQSAPMLHPFPPPTLPPVAPCGTPLLQPFPPPNPLLLLTPSATSSQVLTKEQVGAALLRLAQSDRFIDMIYQEMAKRLYP